MAAYTVAIPSYKRAQQLRDQTLNTLQNANVAAKSVTVFVADRRELRVYESVLIPGTYHRLVVGVAGITNQRDFISSFFPEGENIVQIDDDITSFVELSEQGCLVPVINLDMWLTTGFKLCKQHGLGMFGFYPCAQPKFMQQRIVFGTHKVIGCCFGVINDHSADLKVKGEEHNDFEMNMLHFKKYGGVVRFDNIAMQTKFMTPGGMSHNTDRCKRSLPAAKALIRKYPQYLKPMPVEGFKKYNKSGKKFWNPDYQKFCVKKSLSIAEATGT